MRETVDRSILSLEPIDSPTSVSTGENPIRKISKAVDPYDTKELFGELLTIGDEQICYFSFFA